MAPEQSYRGSTPGYLPPADHMAQRRVNYESNVEEIPKMNNTTKSLKNKSVPGRVVMNSEELERIEKSR